MMRNSGCEVPDYMLQMKKASKRDLKKVAFKPPSRASISTEPLLDKRKRLRREKRIAITKKAKLEGLKGKAKSPSTTAPASTKKKAKVGALKEKTKSSATAPPSKKKAKLDTKTKKS